MHASGSALLTIIERVRAYLDEAALDAKFTNDYLVRHVICPEMVNVMSRLSNNADNLVRVRHSISLVKDQEHYILPPNVGEIYRFAKMDSSGRLTNESMPRGEFNPRGPGWHIEGNCLSIRPFPAEDDTCEIHYIPNGDFLPFYATTGGQILTGGTKFVFGTPDIGGIDKRENAYAGAILRVWDPADAVIEERVIDSFDASTSTVTLRRPFTVDVGAGAFNTGTIYKYEVAPIGMNSLYQAIACSCAVNLGAARNVTQKQMQFFIIQYKMAMKTIGDNVSFMQARVPKRYDKNTVDNQSSFLLGN